MNKTSSVQDRRQENTLTSIHWAENIENKISSSMPILEATIDGNGCSDKFDWVRSILEEKEKQINYIFNQSDTLGDGNCYTKIDTIIHIMNILNIQILPKSEYSKRTIHIDMLSKINNKKSINQFLSNQWT